MSTPVTLTKAFRLSKTTKRRMATITNDKERGEFRRMMIDAELAASIKPVTKGRKDQDKQ